MNAKQSGIHPVVRVLAKDLSVEDARYVSGGTGAFGGGGA